MAQREIEIILLRQWASHMSLPIWVAGTNGDLLYYNEPAEELLGVRFDEAGVMPLAKLAEIFQVTAADGSPMRADDIPLAVALQKGQPSHQRLRYCGLDGAWRDVELTAFPFEGEGRRPLGAVAIWWEVPKT
ncbi:MAG: PAS domain-containing protein [Chloroflexota bacterium]|nr:PAS domain-containing protein [Chloroflexota bacterium]